MMELLFVRSMRILKLVALISLTGCSAFNSPFNSPSNTSSNTVQPNQPVDYQTTDDIPHAISQYLNEIKVAGSGQSEEQSAQGKSKRQN